MSWRYFSLCPTSAIRFQIYKISKLVKGQIGKISIYYSVAIERWRVFFTVEVNFVDFLRKRTQGEQYKLCLQFLFWLIFTDQNMKSLTIANWPPLLLHIYFSFSVDVILLKEIIFLVGNLQTDHVFRFHSVKNKILRNA